MIETTTFPPGRYRLLRKSYLPRRPGDMCEVLDEGETVLFDGTPGPHMEPLDGAARANIEQAGGTRDLSVLDPMEALPLTIGDQGEPAQDEVQRLRAELAGLLAAASPDPL
ncbi:MAG: hypothetical protein HIU82_13900 [Proteobacteria bacterium]|nr:hypothetical protein [Pseudomonadota bacterium]